jgi:hypothetical protein
MAIKSLEIMEARAERRAAARKKKGKSGMRVSGAGVKNLQRLISGRAGK